MGGWMKNDERGEESKEAEKTTIKPRPIKETKQ
jgi:hypothetical protein